MSGWAQREAERKEDEANEMDELITEVRELRAELAAAKEQGEQYRNNWLALQDLTGEDCMLRAMEVIRNSKAERDALAADNARLRSVLVWLDRIGGLGLDVHARITEALAATPAQSLAAHDAALLRKVAKKHAYRRNDGDWTIHPDSLTDEADRIEQEVTHA